MVKYLDVSGVPTQFNASLYKWKYRSYGPGESNALPRNSIAGFFIERDSPQFTVGIPYWFPVLALAALTATHWIRPTWQFSLRTLLIAMTLVAVGLGAVVYTSR
jgi:hypothetical protein